MDDSFESKQTMYCVEKILDKRYIGKKKEIEYLIKWQDYDESDNSWEPKTSLQCYDLLKEFEREWQAKRGSKRKRSKNRPSSSSGHIKRLKLSSGLQDSPDSTPLIPPPTLAVDEGPQRASSVPPDINKSNSIEVPNIPTVAPVHVNRTPLGVNLRPVAEIPELTVKAVAIKGFYFYNGDLMACVETDQGEVAFVNPKALGRQSLDLVMDFILDSIYIKFR